MAEFLQYLNPVLDSVYIHTISRSVFCSFWWSLTVEYINPIKVHYIAVIHCTHLVIRKFL